MRLFIQNELSGGAHANGLVCYPNSHHEVDSSRSMVLQWHGGRRVVIRPTGQSQVPVLESTEPSVTVEDSLLDMVQNAVAFDVVHSNVPDLVPGFVFIDTEKLVKTKCASVRLGCDKRGASALWAFSKNAEQLESFERRLRTESIVVDNDDVASIEESLFSSELKTKAAELGIEKCKIFPSVIRSESDLGCVVEIESETVTGELEARIYWCEEDGNLPDVFLLDGMQGKQIHAESVGTVGN